MKTSKKKVKPFSITLSLGGEEFTASGASILEAIRALPQPKKITNKGDFRIEGNGKSADRVMFVPQVKRLYANKITQELWAKRMGNAIGV